MSAENTPFAAAAERVRQLHSSRVTAADLFWAGAICFAPLCMAVFIGQAMLDGIFAERRQ